MEVVFYFIIGIVLGGLAFFVVTNWLISNHVRSMEEEFLGNFMQMQKAIAEKSIRMKIEKISGEYFAYDIDRGEQFVCRGKTPKKLMEHFETLYSDRLPVVMPEYWELMGMKMDQIVRIGTKDKYGKEKTIKEIK
tara:strand:+ start:33 stop:437 length:405 start_codon:yes stop_codon:yes gene_type:complete